MLFFEKLVLIQWTGDNQAEPKKHKNLCRDTAERTGPVKFSRLPASPHGHELRSCASYTVVKENNSVMALYLSASSIGSKLRSAVSLGSLNQDLIGIALSVGREKGQSVQSENRGDGCVFCYAVLEELEI